MGGGDDMEAVDIGEVDPCNAYVVDAIGLPGVTQ